MINYNPKLWFRHIFDFHKSDTLRILFWELVVIALYCWGVEYLIDEYIPAYENIKGATTVHSLIGFVIGLLLVFRTNSAYERWWEGRKQWGALVNNTRNLALRLNAFLSPEDTENRTVYSKLIANYVFAMKEHLREGVKMDEITEVDNLHQILEARDHKPNAVAEALYERSVALNKKGKLSNEDLLMVDKEIKSFTDIIGACERIKNTPIPYSYNIFLKKFIFIYVATLPFGFMPTFKFWSIPLVVFIFYVLVSLEILAEEIEDPFGTDANDLPTDDLCNKIKGNVHEILVTKK